MVSNKDIAERQPTHPKHFAKEVGVTGFLTPQEYLGELYQVVKSKKSHYSYLDFSEDLGFSRTNVLRLMIAGQRPLSIKSGIRMAQSLELTGVDRRYFMILIKYSLCRVASERDEHFRELVSLKTKKSPKDLNPNQAEYFSEWYHPVIREMTSLKDFNGDPHWIQERLNFGLRLDLIKRSLDLLTTLGYIEYVPDNQTWRRSDQKIKTDEEVDSLALIRYHQKMMEIAKESLTVIDEDQRDIRAATLSVPAAILPVLKAKVAAWINEMSDLEKPAETSDLVVQINVQMFAFTKTSSGRSGGDKT